MRLASFPWISKLRCYAIGLNLHLSLPYTQLSPTYSQVQRERLQASLQRANNALDDAQRASSEISAERDALLSKIGYLEKEMKVCVEEQEATGKLLSEVREEV